MQTIARLGHSIKEVEQLLGLSHQTIYDELNAGRLRSYKVGRRRLVSREALDDWIRARERECNGPAAA